MNYFLESPSKYIQPESTNFGNQYYGVTTNQIEGGLISSQNQINPMTQYNQMFEEPQSFNQQACMPQPHIQNEEMMLGNLPLFNQDYCEQMATKVRHINMYRNGAPNHKNRTTKYNHGLSHPLKLINQSDDSNSSLNFSKQCSGYSNDSSTLVNPLTRQNISDCSKFDETHEPVDQILNIDDLLIKSEGLQD